MDSFLEKWGAMSFDNAMGGDLGTSTLTTSKSSSSSSKMAAPEALKKVKKEKKEKKENKKEKKVKQEKTAIKQEETAVKPEEEDDSDSWPSEPEEEDDSDSWPSGLLRPPPPPNVKAEPVASKTESSESWPGFTPVKPGSSRDLSMKWFGYKRRSGGWKHNPKRARGRGRN